MVLQRNHCSGIYPLLVGNGIVETAAYLSAIYHRSHYGGAPSTHLAIPGNFCRGGRRCALRRPHCAASRFVFARPVSRGHIAHEWAHRILGYNTITIISMAYWGLMASSLVL